MACFDIASQGEPPLGGAGAVIYFSTKRKNLVKYVVGQATNNKAKLSALWATLKVARSNHIQDILIFGDSKVVVDWENGKNIIRAPHLQHLLAEIQELKAKFRRISFSHIYQELNAEVYSLSKQALAYQPIDMKRYKKLEAIFWQCMRDKDNSFVTNSKFYKSVL